MAPVLGILLNLDSAAYPILVATMLVGTPAVSFLGAVGAALTLRAQRGGLLLALIVLPLYIPTLIFGISAVSACAGPGGAVRRSSFLRRFRLRQSCSGRLRRQPPCVFRCNKW